MDLRCSDVLAIVPLKRFVSLCYRLGLAASMIMMPVKSNKSTMMKAASLLSHECGRHPFTLDCAVALQHIGAQCSYCWLDITLSIKLLDVWICIPPSEYAGMCNCVHA